MPNQGVRIAVVQHGDYRDAARLMKAGAPEPYFGMKYSLETLERLFDGVPHQLISLNAERYSERNGLRHLLGMPAPKWPRPVPGKLVLWCWARAVVRQVARFKPTHLLLRSGVPPLAKGVLGYCADHRVSTLAIFANVMEEPRSAWDRYFLKRMVDLLNGDHVFLVGNHKRPATQSMVERGVSPQKVEPWDWPGQRRPQDYPTKQLAAGGRIDILYTGLIDEAKGVGDLVDAASALQAAGRSLSLTILGAGPHLERIRERASRLAGVEIPGRVGNDYAFARVQACTLACVPSRHEFAEGMPMTLTEALASRTPVVASDHPVLKRVFTDGEGLLFFRAKNVESLASTLVRATDPELYKHLSITTADAFARVECRTMFGDLIERWTRTFR